jgi:hypothetical protein
MLDRLAGVAAMLARSYPQVGPFRLMSPVAELLSETARRARSAQSEAAAAFARLVDETGGIDAR